MQSPPILHSLMPWRRATGLPLSRAGAVALVLAVVLIAAGAQGLRSVIGAQPEPP